MILIQYISTTTIITASHRADFGVAEDVWVHAEGAGLTTARCTCCDGSAAGRVATLLDLLSEGSHTRLLSWLFGWHAVVDRYGVTLNNV